MRTTRGSRAGTSVVGAVVVAALGAGACTGADRSAEPPDGTGPGGLRLVGALQSFEACDDLLDYLRREGARVVGAYGLPGGGIDTVGRAEMALDARAAAGAVESAPAPSLGDRFSTTNVQEAGVDEPDLVKTDGRRLVAVVPGGLRFVDVTGEEPRLLATLPLPGAAWGAELLMAGDRVLVLHQTVALTDPPAGMARDALVAPSPVPGSPAQAQVTVVDIADPSAPEVVAELKLDGSLVSARMVDGVARLVLRSGGPDIGFVHPNDPKGLEAATEANRRRVGQSTLDDWLPGYTYAEPGDEPTSGRLADCRAVARPREFSGLGMVSVLTVAADDPRPGPAATVVGAGDLVYASARNLYVTTTRWAWTGPEAGGPEERAEVPPVTTEVHKFDIRDKVRTRYEASGSVPGRLLNQYSMSEHAGDLRVATTSDDRGGATPGGLPASESQVVVLRQDGAALAAVGAVGGLGRGERIYAVRFLGDRGYVVTFRETDPLYVVDLSDPEAPAVRGELKIPGYSAYLHPVGEDLLLGVGQDATEQGRRLGTQVSLFDVSDPASPRRVAGEALAQGQSEAEFDPHAFLYWPATGLAVIPFSSYGGAFGGGAFQGAVAFDVGKDDVDEVGRVRHRDGGAIRRSVVVGDRLLTLSDGGLLASDLATLAERSWLGF